MCIYENYLIKDIHKMLHFINEYQLKYLYSIIFLFFKVVESWVYRNSTSIICYWIIFMHVILFVVAYLIFENTRPSHAYILFSININFISPGFWKIRACCNFTYFCPVSISFQKVPVPNELKNTLSSYQWLIPERVAPSW